jgi:hypothetical protein
MQFLHYQLAEVELQEGLYAAALADFEAELHVSPAYAPADAGRKKAIQRLGRRQASRQLTPARFATRTTHNLRRADIFIVILGFFALILIAAELSPKDRRRVWIRSAHVDRRRAGPPLAAGPSRRLYAPKRFEPVLFSTAAQTLNMSLQQTLAVQQIESEVQTRVAALAADVNAKELRLELRLKCERIDDAALLELTSEIGRLQAQVRAVQLSGYLRVKALLSPQQLAGFRSATSTRSGSRPQPRRFNAPFGVRALLSQSKPDAGGAVTGLGASPAKYR